MGGGRGGFSLPSLTGGGGKGGEALPFPLLSGDWECGGKEGEALPLPSITGGKQKDHPVPEIVE